MHGTGEQKQLEWNMMDGRSQHWQMFQTQQDNRQLEGTGPIGRGPEGTLAHLCMANTTLEGLALLPNSLCLSKHC